MKAWNAIFKFSCRILKKILSEIFPNAKTIKNFRDSGGDKIKFLEDSGGNKSRRRKYEKYQYEAELNNKIQHIENVNKSRRTKYAKYTLICKFS